MKVLKGIIIGFLNIILINLIVILVISSNLKSFITDGIIKETIKQQISANTYEEEKNKIVTDNEQINKLLESKEVQTLIDKYLDTTINGVLDENSLPDIEIEKDMLDFLKKNREVLEKEIGVEITDDMIAKTEEQIDSKELSNVFKQTINNTRNNLPEEAKIVLKGYNFLISLKFKIITMILIFVDLLLIAILQKSFYKWLKSLGISSIVSGCSILLMSTTVNLVVTNFSILTSFNIKPLITSGIALIVAGTILVIVKKLIDKKINDKNRTLKEDANEISEISK